MSQRLCILYQTNMLTRWVTVTPSSIKHLQSIHVGWLRIKDKTLTHQFLCTLCNTCASDWCTSGVPMSNHPQLQFRNGKSLQRQNCAERIDTSAWWTTLLTSDVGQQCDREIMFGAWHPDASLVGELWDGFFKLLTLQDAQDRLTRIERQGRESNVRCCWRCGSGPQALKLLSSSSWCYQSSKSNPLRPSFQN